MEYQKRNGPILPYQDDLTLVGRALVEKSEYRKFQAINESKRKKPGIYCSESAGSIFTFTTAIILDVQSQVLGIYIH